MKTVSLPTEHLDGPGFTDGLLPNPGCFPVRVLGYVMLLLIVSAVTWLAFTEVDIVIEGRGRLTAQGEPVQVSLAQMSRVINVPVSVGQIVQRGDVLFQLDAFEHEAEAARVSAQIKELQAQASACLRRAERLEARRLTVMSEVNLSRRQEALSQRAFDRATELHDGKYLSVEELEREEIKKVDRETQTLQLLREERRTDEEAATQRSLAEEAERKRATLEIQLEQARVRVERSLVRSPVAGVVSWLAVRHPGSVVRPGEPAATLLPSECPLMAKIQIPNSSMRRVRDGALVRIEIDAFPRQNFGQWEGRLERVGPDADERGLYEAWISLVRRGNGKPEDSINLRPGLSVTARILIERRPLLGQLFLPLGRLAESLESKE